MGTDFDKITERVNAKVKQLSDMTERLRALNFNHLKPKEEKKVSGNTVTLTEGAMVITQFKTLADAKKHFDTL